MSDPDGGAVPEPAFDLRLLVAALTGWVALVLLLGRPLPWLIGAAVVSAAMALLAVAPALRAPEGRWLRRAPEGRRLLRAPEGRRLLPGAASVWAGRRDGPGRHRGAGRRSVPPWRATLALCGLLTSLLLTAAAGAVFVRNAGGVAELTEQRAVVTVQGTVGSDPHVLRGDAERNATRVFLNLEVEAVTGRGARTLVATPVLLIARESWAEVRWQSRVQVTGRLSAADPGDSVAAVLTATGPPHLLDDPPAIAGVAERVRAATRSAVSGLPADAAGLLPGLVIGDTSAQPTQLSDDMRATGMTHLCAVSGSNVAVVLSAAIAMCGVLRIPRRARPVVALGLLVAFVILARPEPSVVRAAAMGVVGLIGLSSSRPRAGLPALAGAVVVLLMVDPWLATSYGFALSTLATLGLLLFARSWGARIAGRLPARLGWLGEAIAIPLAAQAMCAPVIVLLQSSIAVVGVAANLLAAPLVAPATVLGVIVALLAVPVPALATAVAWLACLPALGIATIAHTFAVVPFGTLPWPEGVPGALLLAGLTLLGLLNLPWLVQRVRRHPWASLALVSMVLAAVWPMPNQGWPLPGWRFIACDVGQGDALLLRTGDSRAVVIDAGPEDAGVDACLDRAGIEIVDALVLTHFHADHVGGVAGVFEGRRVEQILAGPVHDPVEEEARVADTLRDRQAALATLYAGDVLVFGEVRVTVRWPGRRLATGSVPNNNSLVLDVDAPGMRLLLLADVEREAAGAVRRELADAGGSPVDVLKVAHHGSSNTDAALIEAVAAPVGVISVGADNDYGHPAPSLLRMLAEAGTTAYRTDRDGDVLVGVDGGRVVVLRANT